MLGAEKDFFIVSMAGVPVNSWVGKTSELMG